MVDASLMERSLRKVRLGSCRRNRRDRGLALAPALVATMLLMGACSQPSTFSVSSVWVDLAAVGDTGGQVVISDDYNLKYSTLQYLNGSLKTAGTTQDVAVHAYLLADPNVPDLTALGCTLAVSALPDNTYLCPTSTPGLRQIGAFTLKPITAAPFAYDAYRILSGIWLGVQLVNTTSSTASVGFTNLSGGFPGR